MIKSLQGLRALAMLSIFLFHSGFIPNGIFPVTFFFILSGFVIYYSLNSKVDDCKLKESFTYGFMKIKSLWNIHFLTFLISLIIRYSWVKTLSIQEFIIAGLMNITLTQTLIPTYSLSFNNLSWYLSTLAILYLFAKFITATVKKNTISTLRLIILFLIFELMVVLIASVIIEDYSWFLYMSPYYRILDFILGMLVAKLYIENRDTAFHKKTYYGFFEILCVVLFACVYLISFILPVQYTRGFIYTPVFLIIIYYISLEKGFFKKILCNKYLQIIAKYSFEFYMIHELVLIYFRQLFINIECSYLVKLLLISIPSLIICFICAYILRKIRNNKILIILSAINNREIID